MAIFKDKQRHENQLGIAHSDVEDAQFPENIPTEYEEGTIEIN